MEHRGSVTGTVFIYRIFKYGTQLQLLSLDFS